MNRFFFFSLFLAFFCSKSVAQVDLIELRTAPIFGSQCVQKSDMHVVCAGQPTVVLTDVPCDFDPTSQPTACQLVPHKNKKPVNGVSTLDLYFMEKHIFGFLPLNSPFKLIAADVNNSGTISTLDMYQTRKLILGQLTSFPNNESWRFFPTATTNDFIGVKIGDLNGTASPSNFSDDLPENPTAELPFLLSMSDRFFEKDEIFEVPFSLENAIAFQFTLEHDGLEMLEILDENGQKSENFALFPAEKMTTAAWIEGDGVPFFSLKMRAEKAGRLSDFLKISDQKTPSEAYSSDEQAHVLNLEFLVSSSVDAQKNGIENCRVWPNPTSDALFFEFPKSLETGVFELRDALGRRVLEQKIGGKTARVECAGLASGLYFFKISDQKAAVFSGTVSVK